MVDGDNSEGVVHGVEEARRGRVADIDRVGRAADRSGGVPPAANVDLDVALLIL